VRRSAVQLSARASLGTMADRQPAACGRSPRMGSLSAQLAGLSLGQGADSSASPTGTSNVAVNVEVSPIVHIIVNVQRSEDLPFSTTTSPVRRPPAASLARGRTSWSPAASCSYYRWYVVWRLPGRTFHGIVGGAHPAAWHWICEKLPGRRYAGSGARLQRCGSLQDARQLYGAEAERHGCPEEPTVLRL